MARAARAARAAGVPAPPFDAACFNALIVHRMIAGEQREAGAVVRAMRAAGAEPDGRTEAALSIGASELSRMRQTALRRLSRPEAGAEGRQQAWILLDSLLQRGEADARHCALMLRTACTGAEDVRSAMQRMAEGPKTAQGPKTAPRLDAAAYNALAAELLIEGRAEEAARVLSDEMPAAGVGGDARSEALAGLAEAERSGRSPEDLSRMRTAKLAGLLRAGAEGRREARRLLNALVERGVADAHQTELFCS
jgi:hypothetical protein